jgi:hypothetical protein
MGLSSCAWLTTPCVLCRKLTDLSWEGDEPSAAAAEENPTLAAEESAPLAQAETVAPGAEAMLPEATVAEVITGVATEPAETRAPEVTEEVHDDALPGTNMDVVSGHRRFKTRSRSVRR